MKIEEANDDEVEQAFVNYALGNGDVITAGRYASMLGFEAFEPTGLYQYSTAYDINGCLRISDYWHSGQLCEYSQGVKFTRTSDTTFFGISRTRPSFWIMESQMDALVVIDDRQLLCS